MTRTAASPDAAAFDPSRPGFAEQRFALLAALRAEAAAVHLPALDLWAVTRDADVRTVLADPVTFASGGAFTVAQHVAPEARAVYPLDGPLFDASPINADGARHAALRAALVAAFTPRRVRAVEPAVRADVDELVAALTDRLAAAPPGEPVDLLEALCRPLPVRTICRSLGVPVADADLLRGFSDAFVALQVPGLPAEVQVGAARGLAALEDHVRALVRTAPDGLDDGLVRDLVTADHGLDEDDLVGLLANLLFAGYETTANTLGNGLGRLLDDRVRWAELARGEDVRGTAEELLRLDTSVVGLYRRTTRDVELGGVALPAGAVLWVAFAAANRDPARHPRPDDVVPDRTGPRGHLTFGHGLHVCVGAALARLQVTAVLERLPAALTHLVHAGRAGELPHHALRAPLALPVALATG